ncbi:MAG: hypothetical protein ACK56Q_01615, partial [Pirellulaceae bacterium]
RSEARNAHATRPSQSNGRREKGGWHRLERWVAPIGKVTLVRGVPESPLVGWFSASAGVGDLRRLLVV